MRSGRLLKSADHASIAIAFEPNRGQADSRTSYLARTNGFLLGIESTGSRLLWRNHGKSAEIACRLIGANSHPRLEALDPLPGYSSYFRGRDPDKWIAGIPNFARVRAAQVYPGIDLVYYGNQSQLEYDFVVTPGADPRAIRMQFRGAISLRTDATGSLILTTPAGDLVEHKPVIYQTVAGERRPVPGNFRIVGLRTVSFDVGAYDRARPLTIDPVLAYSSFLGGPDLDEGHALAADTAGNLYLTGRTFTPNGDADVLLRKISPDGSGFVFSADLGGSDNDVGNGIAVGPDGSVYVGGRTQSTDFPIANAFQTANLGTNNAFLLRLDPTGTTLIFSTYVGGHGNDRGFALAVDSQGSAYLAGGATSPDFPTSPGAFQRQNRGGFDCFVVKFDASGNGIFGTLIGGGSEDRAFGIAVDDFGNSYITGQTASDSYPQANPSFQHSRHGGLDAFVTEITADGTGLVYSTFAGGGNDDVGNAIAVDANGNAFVVGTTSSGDFPTTAGAFQRGYAGGASDAFVLAYATNGQALLFSTLLGSHGADEGNGIALDPSDDIFVIGDTDSDQFPVTTDALQPNRVGGVDVVFSVLDPTGSQLLYSTLLGGSGDDFGLAVAADQNSNAYLTGVTSSLDFPVTVGAAQTQYGGGDSDAFFALIVPDNSMNASHSRGKVMRGRAQPSPARRQTSPHSRDWR